MDQFRLSNNCHSAQSLVLEQSLPGSQTSQESWNIVMVTIQSVLVVIALILCIVFLVRPGSVVLLAVALLLVCCSLLAGWSGNWHTP